MLLPPEIQVLDQGDNSIELGIELREDLPCFAGHFTDLPVLAGVVQIGWALQLAERFFACRFDCRGQVSNKFQQLVRPPVSLMLSLQYRPEAQQLKFRYRNALGDCSRGVLKVEEVSK
ncbi:hypothetical protein KO507_08045 [Gilvimarinus agarilyticus]|uniref:ApeI family dehydratase n=1 Tax=unclassified Gilvimarinus TaxID=2642066 RepID=UPI001C081F64|nr:MULTISPECIES: hypothetical protein [unclassified Gilvimarinus]MBU2885710.1 hypothetical protein [Gilvimarinus agarilyticus]MDO6570570.1 hypothetical protein [Gilvimarinus sp. 2_MG-2023]MDO6748500.1 hypothetical protein [Gilvimarinus sp. 1_MG-2023]